MKGIGGSSWAGLKYFSMLLNVRSFWEVVVNTLIISSLQLLAGFPAPIILALMLNELTNERFKKISQTISYLPHFVSWVVLAGVFMQFLSPSVGPLNILLKSLGFEPMFFLGDNKWFRGTLVMTEVWKSVGWGSIIYLAALAGIDTSMYEAAEIDGATKLQRIRHITLPSLAPVITIMMIFSIGKIVDDNFDQIFNLYSPIVYDTGDVIGTYVYRMGIEKMQFSFATAVGLAKNVIAFTLVVGANTISKKINDYGIW
jgi:putative aldouronate transport system permease protein